MIYWMTQQNATHKLINKNVDNDAITLL